MPLAFSDNQAHSVPHLTPTDTLYPPSNSNSKDVGELQFAQHYSHDQLGSIQSVKFSFGVFVFHPIFIEMIRYQSISCLAKHTVFFLAPIFVSTFSI